MTITLRNDYFSVIIIFYVRNNLGLANTKLILF